MNTQIVTGESRRTIASTNSYAEAEAIVDRLADRGFPVQHVSVVGHDLQYVEQVTGTLNAWKATVSGAASGAVLGLIFGLLFGIWFAHDGTSLLAILVYWTVLAAIVGGLISLIAYALSRGRRNFASVVSVLPQRFAVVVDEPFAADAVRRLTGVDDARNRMT